MCYSIYFSTDSTEEFDAVDGEFFSVDRPDSESDGPYLALLDHPHKWFLVSKYGGCSCHFRHSEDAEFAASEEWMHEDPEDVESTEHAYDFFLALLTNGYVVDLLDVWAGTAPSEVSPLPVDLSTIPRDHFRFIANRKLVFDAILSG
jgi:hypothetical protein